MKDNSKKGWKDITLGQYIQIMNIDKNQSDTDVAIDLVGTVYNCNADELPIDEFKSKLASIDLNGEIPIVKVRNSYKINGREYTLGITSAPTVAQFYDYQDLLRKKSDFNKLLIPILIPKGIKYGSENHDFEQCEKDFLSLPIIDAVSITNFLIASWEVLLTTFQQSMEKEIRTNEALTKQEKALRIKEIQTGFNQMMMGYKGNRTQDLAYCQSFLPFVKKQILLLNRRMKDQ